MYSELLVADPRQDKWNSLARFLLESYKWVRKDPQLMTEEEKMLFVIACILTGGDNETKALLVCSQIEDVWNISLKDLTDLAAKAAIKYHSSKCQQAYETLTMIKCCYQKKLPNKRMHLEALPGIGRHTASVILATVFDQQEFAVDLHVKRIMDRLGLKPTQSKTELAYEREATKYLEVSKQLGRLSRAFVDFGQDICGFTPRCNICPLECPSRNKENKSKSALNRQLFENKFIKDSTANLIVAVTIRAGRLNCTCASYQTQWNCSHTKEVKEKLLVHLN